MRRGTLAEIGDLPDVNVWISLSSPAHRHYDRAQQYWIEESAARINFCRVTSLGFLRLAMNRHVMSADVLTMPDAWNVYEKLRSQPRVGFAHERSNPETSVKRWVLNGLFTRHGLTDAYLAAFAIEANLRLVTFDSDFARFPGLNLLHLAP